ncbi:NAD-dependent malic enzyme [Waterburya agarophytonicola K14]|uniref:NAD-dependent malic enzyme n=1 Tax=Waterburya agarophytonicola KI4 TaxID=2874699 RepID=A0A964BMQ2_9CYAN|nr:malic enzyme-like NAD(P)-binding protein [Waterburya agarophytonicola]MCC0176223.1 NAD-dependent malic enzyme [Waterburya agarophytonicola KI4]
MVELNPSASFSLKIELEIPNRPGALASIMSTVASVGGSLGDIVLLQRNLKYTHRELTIDASSTEQGDKIIAAIKSLPKVKVISYNDRTFAIHRGGKISVESKLPLNSQSDLAMAYTPGVGRICRAIAENPEEVYNLTIKSNTVAVVTDGSAVLGLGNLGPEASLPVMEGKALLFKEFAGIDAFPIALDTQDTEEIIKAVKQIAPVFGGVNLEDITAPRCFEIEHRLRQELDIPVFHDDQHGTAIVVLAALYNALKLIGKEINEIKIVINGAGAAGIAIALLLKKAGASNITICDSKGIISTQRDDLNSNKQEFAVKQQGTLADAMKDADVFLGVSAPGVVTPEMVYTMADQGIVFAMANPIPEIQPELIYDYVAVMATGRSDYPNQINNVLAFPGVFRGALDCRATAITTNMYLEAAKAIALLVNDDDLDREHIIPSVFDKRVATTVAQAVCLAAQRDNIAQKPITNK